MLDSDLGKLILMNFDEVTANTFQHLIEGSAAIRARLEKTGGQVRYTAYGYHGTEILIDEQYQWQTYTSYTQGKAKMRLERIAEAAWEQGIKATVYNCPEIRTNSSDIFVGVELSLFPLLKALKKEQGGAWAEAQWQACRDVLQEGQTLESLLQKIDAYNASDVMKRFRNFAAWPMPNSAELADVMIGTSEEITKMHKSRDALVTDVLSSLVLEGTGPLMFHESSNPAGAGAVAEPRHHRQAAQPDAPLIASCARPARGRAHASQTEPGRSPSFDRSRIIFQSYPRQ